MKNKAKFLIVPLVGWMLFSANTSAETQKVEANKQDSSKDTLYIEYRENQIEYRNGRYNSMDNEMDRYYYLKSNFEKAFEKAGWPVNLEFSRFPIKAPEGATVLHMTFMGLEAHNPIEVELRMWATLKRGDKTDDYGIQLVKHVPSPLTTSGSVERDLNTIYGKAANRVVSDLNGTLFKKES